MSLLLFVSMMILGCGKSTPPVTEKRDSQTGPVTIAGSTSILPLIEACIGDFRKEFPTWHDVSPKLTNQPTLIETVGGGSGFGISSVKSGLVQIGMVARPLTEADRRELKECDIQLVGIDAVVLAAREDNPLFASNADVTLEQLRGLLLGKWKTYREMNPALPDKPIKIVCRDEGAGTTGLVESLVLQDKQIEACASVMESEGALVQELATDRYAMGCTTLREAGLSPKVSAFAIDGIAPTNNDVANGKYPLLQPLYLVTKKPVAPAVEAFTSFVMNREQETIEAAGFVPVRNPPASTPSPASESGTE
ncbi:PstS family phosphate ABC transporter substrate-binding protein [Kolteria novifilia]